MISYEQLGWVANIFLLSSSWVIGRKDRTGFLISLVGQAIYIYISTCRENYSMAFLSSSFACMGIWNWRLWGQDENT